MSAPGWVAQEKCDGHRVAIGPTGDRLWAANRKGLEIPLPPAIADSLAALPGDILFDGEMIGQRYAILAVLRAGNRNLTGIGFLERLACARGMETLIGPAITLAPVAVTPSEREALLARMRAENGEGIVFKRAAAPYCPGRPASDRSWPLPPGVAAACRPARAFPRTGRADPLVATALPSRPAQ